MQTSLHRYFSHLANLFQKPTFLFVVNRYFGYMLQFVRGILVANFLGPFFFGVWGFLLLVNQYLSYTSLGLPYAINVELAIDDTANTQHQTRLIGYTLTFTTLLLVVLAGIGGLIQYLPIPLFTKYSFGQYALSSMLWVGFTHLTQVYANIYRVYQRLGRIMAAELLLAILPLVPLFFFTGEQLIQAMLMAMIVASALAVAIYTIRAPFPIQPLWDWSLNQKMLTIGLPLLIYNLSFWMLMIAGRTIISIFYSVEMMGYFSLANTLTSATLLGLNTVAWVIFPTILAKTRLGLPQEQVYQTVKQVNTVYGTAVFVAVLGMILLTPLLFMLLPEYQPAAKVLVILLLAQALISTTYGYNCVAIARKQQLRVALMAVIAVVVVVGLGLIAAVLNFGMDWIAMSMLVGAAVFAFLQAQLGHRIIFGQQKSEHYWQQALPIGILLAIFAILTGQIVNYPFFFTLIGLVIFILTSFSQLQELWQTISAQF